MLRLALIAAFTLTLPLAGCASHNRADEAAGARAHPGDSVRVGSDTGTAYRIRDTVPDTTAAGRRDTTTQR